MLLYLNNRTFCDDGTTEAFLNSGMDVGVQVVLVQELDPGKGACAFNEDNII